MDLPVGKLVVGTKQVLRAISEKKVVKMYVALDADEHILQELLDKSKLNDIAVQTVQTKSELGKACGIKVGSACAAIVKD